MRAAADALDRVSTVVERVSPIPQGRYAIPWPWWRKQLPGTIGEPVLGDMEVSFADGISRQDLRELGEATKAGDAPGLLRMFVATMMWGVGTGDGRGAWRTAQGLRTAGALGTIVTTAALVRQGDIAAAYRRLSTKPGRLERIGESFFTKWLWAAGVGVDLSPQPLILDDQVRASLLALQWRPDVRGDLSRYLAYLEQCAAWGVSAGVEPETIELALFEAGGEL